MPVAKIPQSNIPTLPMFSAVRTDTIVESIKAAIQHCKDTIEAVVTSGAKSFDSVVVSIDEADDALSRIWSPIRHMNSVVSSDQLREAHDACLPLLSEYGTYVGQHKALFECYQAIQQSEEYANLSQAQRKAIDNAVRDFKLSGVDLDDNAKTEYAAIQTKLSELSSKFSNNVLDATMHFHYVTDDESELSGLPDSALAAAKQLAESKQKAGYMFTLDIPSYLPVITYADNRALREKMYKAYVTRASELDTEDGQFDNTNIIEETLALRKQKAELLGFENYSEYSIASKMAETNEQVLAFLNALADKSKPQAKTELDEIEGFAKSEFDAEDLQAWDYSYYAEKLKQAKYSISDEQLRPYFPEDKAVFGLFEVISRLYDIDVVEVDSFDKWHDDVRFFELQKDGAVRGAFYLDLYAREKKRGGAWM
ncbi:MAG: M3 family metallopeptidase, partial [Pseudomonadota bacterium]